MVHIYGHDCKRLQQVSLRGCQNNSMQCSWCMYRYCPSEYEGASFVVGHDWRMLCCGSNPRPSTSRFIILRTTTTMTTMPLDCFTVPSMFFPLCYLCSPDMPQCLCHFILPSDCMLTITVVTGFLSDCALTISILPMRQYKATRSGLYRQHV